MIRYRADVTLWPDALRAGPLPNPTRSVILGVPKDGGFGVGCQITLRGRPDIPAGVRGEALIEMFESDEWDPEESILAVMPLWYGKVIGEARGLTRLAPSDPFPAAGEG